MAVEVPSILALNRGRIGKDALARLDLKRMAYSAEVQTNVDPNQVGAAMLRPGLQYIGKVGESSTAAGAGSGPSYVLGKKGILSFWHYPTGYIASSAFEETDWLFSWESGVDPFPSFHIEAVVQAGGGANKMQYSCAGTAYSTAGNGGWNFAPYQGGFSAAAHAVMMQWDFSGNTWSWTIRVDKGTPYVQTFVNNQAMDIDLFRNPGNTGTPGEFWTGPFSPDTALGAKQNGGMCALWIGVDAQVEGFDITVDADWDLWWESSTTPRSLEAMGLDGSGPTGVKPLFFFPYDASQSLVSTGRHSYAPCVDSGAGTPPTTLTAALIPAPGTGTKLGGLQLNPSSKQTVTDPGYTDPADSGQTGSLDSAGGRPKMVEFVNRNDDTALAEIGPGVTRFWVNDVRIDRPVVATTIANPTFDYDLSSWTDDDDSGGVSSWRSGGYMQLLGDTSNRARRKQTVTVAGGDQNVEHALRITIQRGPVQLRVGSADGLDDYIEQTDLTQGVHSLSFTPTGNFYIELSCVELLAGLVDAVQIESSGPLELPNPWTSTQIWDTNEESRLRWVQSADVIYFAAEGKQQRKIERRGTRSWSLVYYQPEDGPFRFPNLSEISLSPSAQHGEITLTASDSLFRSTHVGALFRVHSVGQAVSGNISAEDTWTDPIKILGVDGSRYFHFSITGTWSGKVTIQQSFDQGLSWSEGSITLRDQTTTITLTHTSNYAGWLEDSLDNQEVWYRIGIATGDYTSGTAVVEMSTRQGSTPGICRITAVASGTSASADVLQAFGKVAASKNWEEGIWSDYRGWPSAVALEEGRLWWAGKDWIIGSVSDGYESFDDTIEGGSGPIIRTIGEGPVDIINWIMGLERIILGAQGSEIQIKPSNLDEPPTPANFGLKRSSRRGSTRVAGHAIHQTGAFIDGSGRRVFELLYSQESGALAPNYQADDLGKMVPRLNRGIGEEASPTDDTRFNLVNVQYSPETRIHVMRTDGSTAINVYNPLEDLRCWFDFSSNVGRVLDIAILPASPLRSEDHVYYVLERTDGYTTEYWLCKWALRSQCEGGQLSRLADAHVIYQGSAATVIGGGTHLNGETVVVWADGKDVGNHVVSGGNITLSVAASNVCYGLGYTGRFKGVELAYAAQLGTALLQRKRVSQIGFRAIDTHYQGLWFGGDFDHLDPLPLVEDGKATAADYVWPEYHKDKLPFDGNWAPDSRICFEMRAPRPANVCGITFSIATGEQR